MKSENSILSNWNNYPKLRVDYFSPYFEEDIQGLLSTQKQIVARGNGRCYGDASLGNGVVNMLNLNNFLHFNEELGIITCQSGVLLSDILSLIVRKGWFLPVTPGTQFITVGGALASDVHGKNHHKEGSFSDFVLNFTLIRPDGSIMNCSPNENKELFWFTLGGMGLTGIILDVTFSLKKISSQFIREKKIKASNLSEILEMFDTYNDYTYSVAWIDCLKRGSSFGRSILMLGEHATKEEAINLKTPPKIEFTVPFNLPSFTLNPVTIRAFNALFYQKEIRKISESLVFYKPYFYPLDSIYNWNRIYGSRGFLQYQFVVPKVDGKRAIEAILKRIANKKIGSFLAVLKSFGQGTVPLSFQMPGYTLALDMPLINGLFSFLDELDKMVYDFGGRLYLSKDARMSSELFYKSYPKSYEFAQFVSSIDPQSKIVSHLSKRLKIK